MHAAASAGSKKYKAASTVALLQQGLPHVAALPHVECIRHLRGGLTSSQLAQVATSSPRGVLVLLGVGIHAWAMVLAHAHDNPSSA